MNELIPWRKAVLVLGAVTLLSAGLHWVAFQGPQPPFGLTGHGDTNEYLEVVALVRGLPLFGPKVPFRMGYPLYPLLIAFMELFTSDCVYAARLAALVPSVLVAPLLCVLAWTIDARFWSGLLAGILGACSWPLVSIGLATLADAPFVFLSALTLLLGLLFLRKGGMPWALAAGIAAGCAWSTKALGLCYLLAILIPCFARFVAPSRDQALKHFGSATAKGSVIALFVFIAAFFAAGKGPAFVIRPYASGLRPTHGYLKEAVMDEALVRTQGWTKQNQVVFSLNTDCTDLVEYDAPWADVWREYGRAFAYAVKMNLIRQVEQELPMSMAPFALVFVPLAVGLVVVWRQNSVSELALLSLFGAPYVVVLPFITLDVRFLLPLAAVTMPLSGIGLARLMVYREHPSVLKRWIATGAGVVLLTLLVVYGAGKARSYATEPPDKSDSLYRQGCAWILQDNQDPNAAVMTANWAVYAYTNLRITTLPSDPPDRVIRYCRNTNTRYIVLCSDDKEFNPTFFRAFAGPDATVSIDGALVRVIATFGEERGRWVRVMRVERQES
jgi:hypothetical protein